MHATGAEVIAHYKAHHGSAMASSRLSALAIVSSSSSPRPVHAAAQALNVLNEDFFLPFLIGIAIVGIAAGLAIVRSRLLPVWLGWIAIVVGLVAVTPASFVAFPRPHGVDACGERAAF